MKVLVSMFVFAVSVAAINATCVHCKNQNGDYQEIKYEDLKTLEDFSRGNQNNEFQDVAQKVRMILKLSQQYQFFVQESKKNLKFSDPMSLIDATEFFTNGEIEYSNAKIQGLGNTVLKEININQIDENMFSVHAFLKKAEVVGDYAAASSKNIESGQFYITLNDIEFNMNFRLNEFMETRPEFNEKSLTLSHHESTYTNTEVLNQLQRDQTQAQKSYNFYYNYLNKVIKIRLAEEMAVSFAPLVAKRLVQKLNATVLFPTKFVAVPKVYAYAAPGIQAKIYNTMFQDLSAMNQIQKLVNYTMNNGQTEMLFSFTSFDLRGTNEWDLEYNTGNVYSGRSSFAIDNMQTMTVVTKPVYGQGPIAIKFSKTTLNGLTVMLNNDDNCETIRDLAHQRIPNVLKDSLKAFIDEQTVLVLKNQLALVGLKYNN